MQHSVTHPIVRPWLRPVYFVLGALFLVVGVVGVALPLIPTTGPVLLAAFFFARSSDRFHEWLTLHPRFGPLIEDFRSGKGIPLRTKVWALTAMTLAFGFSAIFMAPGWIARSILFAVAILAIGYVARLPISRR